MKKIIFIIILLVTALTSCTPTNEDRAKEMVSDYLKGVIYDFYSYEPITTTVDSLFVSVTTDEEAISLTEDLMKLLMSASECAEIIQDARQDMDRWGNIVLSSSYSRGEYKQAKQKKEQQEKLLGKYRERIKDQFKKIKSRQSFLDAEAAYKTGDFGGWIVYQKFKSTDSFEIGNPFGEYIFICDKDFQNCKGYEKKEFDTITKVMGAIGKSNEITDLQDKLFDVTF